MLKHNNNNNNNNNDNNNEVINKNKDNFLSQVQLEFKLDTCLFLLIVQW